MRYDGETIRNIGVRKIAPLGTKELWQSIKMRERSMPAKIDYLPLGIKAWQGLQKKHKLV